MSDIKKNDIIELEITSVSNLGYGVGRSMDGKVVFTPGTVTGEKARVKIIKITKGYLVGKLIDIISESPLRDRCEKCTAPATCGGCAYRFVDYGHELELKKQNVRSEFDKAGLSDVAVLDTACVRDTEGNAVVWHYRNKAQYRFANAGDCITAGFYASGTHRVIGNEACPLQPEIFGEIAAYVCDFAEKRGISVYDEESGKGLLRHLYIRSGSGENGEICVCIVVNGRELPYAEDLAERLRYQFERIVGVVLNVNRKNSNLILGDEYITVSGKCEISDVFCGVELDVSPAAFYQVNHDAAEMLCRIAADRAELTGDEHLLDLYCGIGSVGLSMAHKVRRLTGVEIVPQAVECAVKNASRAGIENARFVCADSADGAADILAAADEMPDVVVLDPPRKGCAPELLDSLTNAGIKKVVYISCNPATLARDCAQLAKQGWSIGEVQPVDLFPRTGHCETVVLLSREKVSSNDKEGTMISDNKSKYKSWSNLKKQMNDLLCDSLKDKISYFYTNYHEVHNAYGRATINYNKKEMVAFSWVEMYAQEQDVSRLYNEGKAVSYGELEKGKWMTECKLCDADFIHSLTIFLKTDIAESIHSDNYLLRIFAYLDRRIGKRTLIKIKDEVEALPEWVLQFYRLRCEAEGIVSLPKQITDECVTLLSRTDTEHRMKLHSAPFEMIKSGQKTIEFRLNDEKRQMLKIGDDILFTNTASGETLKRRVLNLHYFNSFDELYKSLPLLKCGYTEQDVGSAKASDMEVYYSLEELKKYGVVGIELCRCE